MIRRSMAGLAALALVFGGGPAGAILPATPAQILCGATYVIVGHVLTASSADCRVTLGNLDARCSPTNLVRLKVQVKAVLGAQAADAKNPPGRALWPGETIDAITSAKLSLDPRDKFHFQGGLVFRGIPSPSPEFPVTLLSNERLTAAYANQDFLMSVSMTKSDLELRDSLSVVVWPTSRKEWARHTMDDPALRRIYDCPRLT
jgi:hypothetical protein